MRRADRDDHAQPTQLPTQLHFVSILTAKTAFMRNCRKMDFGDPHLPYFLVFEESKA
jgi:hypothetical protein